MEKVYLVTTQSGAFDYFNYEVISVCSTIEIAEKEMLKIQKDTQNIKTQYFLEFGSDYDSDLESINEDLVLDNEDKYIILTNNIIKYQMLYKELDIHTIQIEERELL